MDLDPLSEAAAAAAVEVEEELFTVEDADDVPYTAPAVEYTAPPPAPPVARPVDRPVDRPLQVHTAGVVAEAPPWRDAWVAAAAKLPSLLIIVEDPAMVGSALNRHVEYRVRSSIHDEEHEVNRRFSEFEALRNALVARYPGLLIPPIPPKTVKLTDAKLMKSRTRILSLFVERLSSLPWVADDPMLRGFLSEANWSANTVDKIIHVDESTGRGRAAWFACVQRSPTQVEPDRRLTELQVRLEALIQTHEFASKAIAKTVAASNTRAESLGLLLEGIGPWRGESARWSAQTTAGALTERSASTVHSALRTMRVEAALEAPALDLTWASSLQWQCLSLGAMKELVQRRQALSGELYKSEQKLASLRSLKLAGKPAPAVGAADQMRRISEKTKGFFGGLSKTPPPVNEDHHDIDESISKAESALREASKALEHHLKALCYSEVERFDAEHEALSEIFARRFFLGQRELAARLVASWDEALDALGNTAPATSHAPVVAAALEFDVSRLLDPAPGASNDHSDHTAAV